MTTYSFSTYALDDNFQEIFDKECTDINDAYSTVKEMLAVLPYGTEITMLIRSKTDNISASKCYNFAYGEQVWISTHYCIFNTHNDVKKSQLLEKEIGWGL